MIIQMKCRAAKAVMDLMAHNPKMLRIPFFHKLLNKCFAYRYLAELRGQI